MDESRISLSGSGLFITELPGEAFRVESGRVLVFIIPFINGKKGRRRLMAELGPGEAVPALSHSSLNTNDEMCHWMFGLTALAPSTLHRVADNERIREEFAGKAGLKKYRRLGFEESAVEVYRLESMREQRNLFASGEERKSTYRQTLSVIYRLFGRGGGSRRRRHDSTGNQLYDACACLCDWQGIEPVSIDVIQSNCGRNFSARDVARISGFLCRNIMLGEKWYRQDSGPLLAFRAEGNRPVVCLPHKPGRYVLWDPADDTMHPVTADVAAELSPKAMVFYRPFPRERITIRKLMAFAAKDLSARDVCSVLLLTLLGTLIGLLLPYLNEQLYDLFIPLGDVSGLMGICSVVLACSLGNICFQVVKNLSAFRALNRMKYSVQAAVLDRLFNLPESFFRNYESADLGQRAMGISGIFSLIASTAVGVVLSSLFSLVYIGRMLSYSKSLSGISFLMLAVTMLIIVLLGRQELKYEREQMAIDGRVASMMFQFLSGISKLRIAGAENRALYEYLRQYTDSRKLDMRKANYSIATGIIGSVASTAFSVVFYYMMVNRKIELSMGAFMGFMTAFGAFSGAMMDLVKAYLSVNSIGPAFERMKPILDTLPEQQEDAGMPGEVSGDIEVSNVVFSYSEDGPEVLKGISFHIREGEYIGIVGSSGCGKSTLLKLLLGFEKPQSGRIYFDGRDIDSIDKRELRKKFGVVLQNGGIISGSIQENITITTPTATLAQVQEAVNDAGLKEDISAMPMGLHTVLSEGDGSISGGQRQRILIARAIVGKPRLLFFDEATSALDNVTQNAVCESLDKLKSTRVVIAHRLSTVIRCDRIFVMSDGRIVEEGNFSELMARRGMFYELASRQLA